MSEHNADYVAADVGWFCTHDCDHAAGRYMCEQVPNENCGDFWCEICPTQFDGGGSGE